MKKLIMMLAVALAAAMPLMAATEIMDTGYTWTYRIANGEAEITSGGTLPAVSPIPDSYVAVAIPAILGGCPVTRIGDYALMGVHFSSLTIHEGVKSIGDYAFCGIGRTSYVILPESLTSIGAYAFSSNHIDAVTTIPQGVTDISQHAFAESFMYLRMAKTWEGKFNVDEKQDVLMYSNIYHTVYYEVGVPCTVSFFKELPEAGPCSVMVSPELIGERVVKCGEQIGALPLPPPREGYRFDGWWIGWSAVCVSGVDVRRVEPGTIIYGDVDITASWTKDQTWYALSGNSGDRTIVTLDVSAGTSIPSFVLQDDKVYDRMLRVINTTGEDVRITLPAGYFYEKFKGTDPLTMPHATTNMLSITRTADKVFLVSREEVESLQ